jgi:hypothetical protein
MARTLYQYNPKTCRYEPVTRRKREVAARTIMFFMASLSFALFAFFLYSQNAYSITELWLKNRNGILRNDYALLERRTEYAYRKLQEVIDKDDNNYRVILDTPPLPASIREGGTGGS